MCINTATKVSTNMLNCHNVLNEENGCHWKSVIYARISIQNAAHRPICTSERNNEDKIKSYKRYFYSLLRDYFLFKIGSYCYRISVLAQSYRLK